MDDLPPELHFKIYKIACRDDGATGSSLSSVSKRIRHLAAEYRYQSIAVCGPIQLQRLVEALRVVPQELRRIRFLFIYDYCSFSSRERRGNGVTARPSTSSVSSCARRHPSGSLGINPTAGLTEELRRMFDGFIQDSMFDDPWDRLVHESVRNVEANIREILAMAKTTVQLLSLVSFNEELDAGGPASLLRGSFPSLLHLTIRGPHELPRERSFAPLLRTLHVNDTQHLTKFSAVLAQNHPFLTRLRISRAFTENYFGDLIRFLYVMRIVEFRAYFKTGVPPAQMVSGVERLILLEPRTLGAPTRNRRLTHEMLHKLDSGCRGFHLLPSHPNHKMSVEARLALRDWMMCAEGKAMLWGEARNKLAWDANFIAE
ncbi:hypothetical protein DFH06DRAFT_1059236 [Mycena polygramma]|nr:hypothetical protein DFH06DRAFT_1059236 [Mycena polygramma]